MGISNNLALVECVCFGISFAFILIWSFNPQIGHSSSFVPEMNSTISNMSTSDFERNPITTVVVPNKSSMLVGNLSNNEIAANVTMQDVYKSNSTSAIDMNSVVVKNQSDAFSSNYTSKDNGSRELTNNNNFSDSQQRGKYLTDNDGNHYYNINNCSEKKGSSGIGELSECEDAAKEISEG